MLTFEYDERKELTNIRKHEIEFQKAALVFLDPALLIYEDERRDYGEVRNIALGTVEGRLLQVVYTPRQERMRIISARKANKKEQRLYENVHP